MTTHLSQLSRLLAAAIALAVAVIAALVLTQMRDSGGGAPASPLNAPAAVLSGGVGITLHRSQSTSKVTVEGKTAKGESVTSVGKPGKSARGKAGKDGRSSTTGNAKGGDGGSASAKGGSATAGSVVVQTTTP